MAKTRGVCLYKEARLNIEPAYPASTVSITLPAAATSSFSLKTDPKHSVFHENYTDQDDEAFAKRHLASDGSMYFRHRDAYPRSILRRVLDGRRTLEIQATDLDHDITNRYEANLTLLLHFTSPIRPFCIAFADSPNALTVFAITNANELYTITLHTDFFTKPASSEQVKEWCTHTAPTLLQNNDPYRMVAVSANELLVSLDNGAIVRLTRTEKDAMDWTEAVYQQNSWSLRGMLPWKGQQTVRFGNADIAVSSVAAMALSPDGKHIISACLDHRLRIYNLASGKLSCQQDLLHKAGPQELAQPYTIGPSQSTLLQVIDMPGPKGAAYYLVTYSPKEHQFKFWGVRDADDDTNGIFDVQSEVDFVPPVDELMDATVWTMEEFFVIRGAAGWRGTELWIRARSGPSSGVFNLRFDLLDDDLEDLDTVWKTEWVAVNSGPLTVEALRKINPGEQDYDISDLYELDTTEQWLDFLFYPNRFTISTLETALLFFRKGLERNRSTRPIRGSLKDRLCATVSAFATTAQDGPTEPENYERAIAEQWQAYYGLVKDLHKRRGESLTLAYDYRTDMPWLVLSDYLSAIRKCNDSEIIALNSAALSSTVQLSRPLEEVVGTREQRAVANLLNAAAGCRRRVPSLRQELPRQVKMDLLQNRSVTVIDRMELMEGECDLYQLLTDDDLVSLVEELGMDYKALTTELFLQAIKTLDVEKEGNHIRRRQIARYGLSALHTISQEALAANYEHLLDLLFLILFLQYEEETSDDFDASVVFVELLSALKDNMVLTWLATSVWSHQAPTSPSSTELLNALRDRYKTTRLPMLQTVLEGIYSEEAFACKIPTGLKSGLLTHWSCAWIAMVFDSADDYKGMVEGTMGKLLFQKEYGLARDFAKFLPESTWATYLKGRLHVALGENALASVCFQKIAYTCALGMWSVEDNDSESHLVTEPERNEFSEGLPRYYHHVLGLFEKVKAHSYAADFGRLGLRTLLGSEDQELKTELLQRFFTASIQTARFDEAYTAMTRHTDTALKHASLQTLITSMVSQSQTAALLKFPFVGLVDEVDATLADLCHNKLNLGTGPQYHQILYSFRISRGNFRGAASILHERLQRLKSTSSKVHDPSDESLAQCYLMIINALSAVREEDAYILADRRIDDVPPGMGKGKKLLKRHIVTLDSLRKEYQAELDRVAAIEAGQFPFVDPADDMDIL